MQIWVDADACPNVIKEILFRVAERARIMVTLVANQAVATPRIAWVQALQVAQGCEAGRVAALLAAGGASGNPDIFRRRGWCRR